MFIQNYIWAEQFGREHVGAIKGSSYLLIMLIGGIGAPLAGYVYDQIGSYNFVWWIGICLLFLASIMILVNKSPQTKLTQT